MMVGIRKTTYGELSEAERSALERLVDEVQHGAPYFDPPERTCRQWSREYWEKLSLLLATEGEGVVLGYLASVPVAQYAGPSEERTLLTEEDPREWVYLAEVGVSAEARGKGVGTALMARFHDDLPATTTTTTKKVLVRTLVRNHRTEEPNPAIGFYQKLGYKIFCRRREQEGHGGEPEPYVVDYKGRERLFLRYVQAAEQQAFPS